MYWWLTILIRLIDCFDLSANDIAKGSTNSWKMMSLYFRLILMKRRKWPHRIHQIWCRSPKALEYKIFLMAAENTGWLQNILWWNSMTIKKMIQYCEFITLISHWLTFSLCCLDNDWLFIMVVSGFDQIWRNLYLSAAVTTLDLLRQGGGN